VIATAPSTPATSAPGPTVAGGPARWNRADGLVVAGLFVLALAVRSLFALAVAFPPLDDPAYYLQVARNLCRGEGFHIAVIWSHLYPFTSVDHPSGELWMPLASVVMCGSWRLLGESWRAAQLPGVLAGAALPPLTYMLGVYTLGCRLRALAAALFLAVSGVLAYQSAAGDSMALFALLITGALLLLIWRPTSPACRPAGLAPASAAAGSFLPALLPTALAGACAGLAYLTRMHALVLVGCWTAGRLRRCRRDRTVLVEAAVFLGMFALIVLPWGVRNLLVFGSWSPPLATIAPFLVYVDGYLALPPAPGPAYVLQHLEEALHVRLEAAWIGLHSVLDTLLFPSALPGWLGAFALARRSPALRLGVGYAAALYAAAVLLAPAPSLTGSYYHSAASSVPVLALGYAHAVLWIAKHMGRLLRWPRPPFWPLWAGVLALALVQSGLAWTAVEAHHRREAEQFATIRAWLAAQPDAPGGTIMTTEPSTLHYLTGRPAVVLPAREPPERVVETMRRYGARYLVLTHPAGRYPDAARAAEQLALVWRTGGTEVFRLCESTDNAVAAPPAQPHDAGAVCSAIP
jgi:hypothetical protein